MNRDEIAAQIPEINRRLLASGRTLGVSTEDVEDLVASTWAAFFENIDRFRGDSKLSTYIFGIFFNQYRTSKRKRTPEPISDQDFDSFFDRDGMWSSQIPEPDSVMMSLETRKNLSDCIDSLTENHQQVFLLKHVIGESTEQICKILAVTITNLGVLLFRAKNQLRKCLEHKAESNE